MVAEPVFIGAAFSVLGLAGLLAYLVVRRG